MKTRTLGKTGIELPILSFGASSLGQEFRSVALDDALKSVQVALDCGLNFIDTSPFYGRGMSEVLLGIALRGVPRDSYKLCTKIGRYDLPHFDFSAKRVAESIDVSLHRLGTDHLDIVLCHDIEFVPMQQIVDETIPALRKAKQAGKVKAIGFSGYPQKIFKFICDQTEVDCVLSYNQHTLQNTRFSDETVPYLKAKGVGVMNAVQRPPAHQRSAPGVAQGAGSREGRRSRRRRALRGEGQRYREARPAVLAPASRHHHDGLGQC
jgi:aryl-alcohol dehydrogenase-like predicted oxidoreductase